MKRYSATEQIGVTTVAGIVVGELKWIFREQIIADMGIDAHIELVEPEGSPTGKLVGLQIKTGKGNFKEKNDHFVYYGDHTHLDYWLSHSLPVVLVAHIPEVGTFWQSVAKDLIEPTAKNWKLKIPKKQIFGQGTKELLRKLFDGSVAQQRLRKLALDEPLMRHIENGGRVSLQLQDWVNKSLGRSPVLVYVYDEDGNETLSQEWSVFYTGFDIKRLAQSLFPWATVSVDQQFYDDYAPIPSDEEILFRALRLDNEETEMDDDDDVSGDDGRIYPYDNMGGEIDLYRLELGLNSLGEAYLLVADHMGSPLPKSPFDPDVLVKLQS